VRRALHGFSLAILLRPISALDIRFVLSDAKVPIGRRVKIAGI
jgi:hypothetical protein